MTGGADRLAVDDAGAGDSHAHDAVRHAALLAAQRGVDVLRALLFAALVPRLLGPTDFGRFALLGAAAYWFAALSGLGSAQLMGRFVPVMVLHEERSAARRLLGNLFALRALTGVASAVPYVLLGRWWLPDLPMTLLGSMAAVVALSSVARVPFAFFLGLNQAARWGAGDLARRWVSLVLVLAGTLVLGLRGACLGLALAEACVLAVGIHWARPHVSVADVRLEWGFVAPYVHYNLAFFGSTLVFALCLRGGEAVMRAAGADYATVGYFGLAAAAWAAAAQAVWMLLMAFLPLLTRLRAQGRIEAAREWAGRLLDVLVAAAVVGCFAAALPGPDLVPRLAGPAFSPAVPLLLPVSVALLAQVACSVGRLMALVLDRPRLALAGTLAQAAVLVGLGLPMAYRFGGVGVAWAMAAASAAHGVVVFAAVQRDAPLCLGRGLAVAGLGLLFAPLALLPVTGLAPRAAVFAVMLAGYAAALHRAGLVTTSGLSDLARPVRASRG